MEAGCCGLPVVGFDVGGTKETALPEFSSFVGYGDVTSLSNQIMLFLKNDILKNKRVISEINTKRFSRETMFKNYHSLYKKVLEEY